MVTKIGGVRFLVRGELALFFDVGLYCDEEDNVPMGQFANETMRQYDNGAMRQYDNGAMR